LSTKTENAEMKPMLIRLLYYPPRRDIVFWWGYKGW